MIETYAIEQLQGLVGHEIVDPQGESVGFVDLVFLDDKTGKPEWLGVWNGIWATRPRVLVPLASVEQAGSELRVPWSKDVVEGAPTYDDADDRGLFGDDEGSIGISPEKERAAYEHYGLTPGEATANARLRAWDHPERAEERP